MAIETQIEKDLIKCLTMEDSQWTYRPDLKTEQDLWENLKKILENNNRDKLNGTPLSEAEFRRVKNQIICTSFYDAGVKLKGENGIFSVYIDRENKRIPLVVFNRHMKSGGSSVYEIINQYNSSSNKDKDNSETLNRRFDVTFLINGLPLIHMELKNGKNASYLEAFNQIQKYIREGHFKGIYSLIQMFVVSNVVQTKYIAANENMQEQFLTCWTEKEDPDKNVSNLFDFTKGVLRIPQAHEMVTDYCQLDASNRELKLLRPYQIQAIQAIREAYSHHTSGYIWHTTGSGKTLTSYKASRNMLNDIPNLDKTLFLIDRRDLDDKTNRDFKSYADNDSIAISDTESSKDLEKKLKSDKREMIVTTIQKLQALIRKCQESKINENIVQKIKSKRVAFVVDECHRTVTKDTQVELNKFFRGPMWYGFTGTPIFVENQGSLGATTKELYGEALHKYTIKNALHDKAVLGFQIERLGPSGLEIDENGYNVNEDYSIYNTKEHMLGVIDTIINKSSEKFGLNNGPGKTYQAILTVGTIARAQRYFELIKSVKDGNEKVKINSQIKSKLQDFPKVAVTYSLSENKSDGSVNSDKMMAAIDDYNHIFDKHYNIQDINTYNDDLTERLTRKSFSKYSRTEQLDLVIVADRLLTGFDSPSLSTVFIDRPPMSPHKLIQTFSRTNRLFDKNKKIGFIVTFQSPDSYKKDIDAAIKLFSLGGNEDIIAPPFEELEKQLIESILKLKAIAPKPEDCNSITDNKTKRRFCKAFQKVDATIARIKGYFEWTEKKLEDYNLSSQDYNDYAGWYRNFIDELKSDNTPPDSDSDDPIGPDVDYTLQAYGKELIDYLYVLRLIQAHTQSKELLEDVETQRKKEKEIDTLIETLEKQNPKMGQKLKDLWSEVKENPEKYRDKDLVVIFEEMKNSAVDKALHAVSDELKLNYDDVKYSADHYTELMAKEPEVPYFSEIKKHSNPQLYKITTGKNLIPLDYYKIVRYRLKEVFDNDVLPYKD